MRNAAFFSPKIMIEKIYDRMTGADFYIVDLFTGKNHQLRIQYRSGFFLMLF